MEHFRPQSKAEIERFYSEVADPWAYKTTPCDVKRKMHILNILAPHGMFDKALDIGCGEAWVTQDLPARVIHGYELSDTAAARFPPNVTRTLDPQDKYDLVVATGVLYHHYDYRKMLEIIARCASHIVLTCNIKSWEVPEASLLGKEILTMEFPYRDWTQKLRLFDVYLPQNWPTT